MNKPAASYGVSELGEQICVRGVTPECLNRGSTVLNTTLSHVERVGGPLPVSLVVSTVEPPIETFGNDEL